ncbi:MAG: DEAD/DEAH box helicase family protein [Candidatus Colwellbacteria bacterium]|nr:DEAD/DEAH box helicase family protein [Candidatus Colwellbacteria bacterium]
MLHQQDCLDRLQAVRKQGHERALIVVATGLGKTVISALDIKQFRKLKRGGRVLYLCHQKDILRQARRTFELVLGEEATYGYFHGMEKHFHDVDCLFASFQSMREWREAFLPDEFDYIVIDESHHGPAPTYRPTIEYFEPKFLLGITATPDRTDLQDIREIYGREVYSLPIEEALAKGLLTRVDYRLITDELVDLKVLETPVGKLSITELNKRLFVPKRDEEIAQIIQKRIKKIKDPRVMIFCPSVDYCIRLSALLPEAIPIHYRLSGKDQEIRLELFRQGRVRSVLTVDKFNEGIDIPEANVIVFLRSTASRMLFFQQLGRGLRKVEGKKKVLVLDFVGNCERLELVHYLWSEVMTYHSHKISGNGPAPIEIDVGSLKFSEVTKNVLDVIMAVRGGYTKEILIKQLRQLAERIGRIPRRVDVDKASHEGRCAHSVTFTRVFGSFPKALLAAGFEPNYIRSLLPSKEEMIRLLRELGDKLKRVPSREDIRQANKEGFCPSCWYYEQQFGSLPEALTRAGFNPRRSIRHTPEELIERLQWLTRELGHQPSHRELRKVSKEINGFPTILPFLRAFGNLDEAFEAAGLSRRRGIEKYKSSYTEDEIVSYLQSLAKQLGKTPSAADVGQASAGGKGPGSSAIARRFGSFNAALEAAGLLPLKRNYTDEELIDLLRQCAEEIGKVPGKQDLLHHGWPSPNTYRQHFGSYAIALERAGLTPTARSIARSIYSFEDIVRAVRKVAENLGRVPTLGEYESLRAVGEPTRYTISRRLGDWKSVLKAADLTGENESLNTRLEG